MTKLDFVIAYNCALAPMDYSRRGVTYAQTRWLNRLAAPDLHFEELDPRTACDIQRELRLIVAALLLHPATSRSYRALKLRRDALSLEFGLTYSSAVFKLGAL